MLFQSLLYCSNSCTSLHFKTLKSHTKTLKIRPYMFRSPLKPSSGTPRPYVATRAHTHTHTHRRVSPFSVILITSIFLIQDWIIHISNGRI
jgi:hypothetical protein